MFDVAVIEDAAAAEVSLDPIRANLLSELSEPGSATTLAGRVGLPRQKVNYHLRALEKHGLVELVEERRKGNVTERVLRATARLVGDVGTLITGATKARKRVATFAIDGEVRFATAADRAAFAEELATSMTALVSKYHADEGRSHRLIVAVHPKVED
jgi:DNA-binding transcriptional ArsR family regulator